MRRRGPDSVTSWLMAVCCFFLYFIFYGILRMSGIMYVGCMDRFGVNHEMASLPFVIAYFMQSPIGPVSGFIARKYGPRPVIIFGTALATLGSALSFWAENITAVSLLYGIIHGTGNAFCNVLFSLIIVQHFIKQRATAMGLAFSGSYIGSFIFPLVLDYCILQYGMSGTFLIISAIFMHALPFAMLLRDPELTIEKAITNENIHYVVCSSKDEELHMRSFGQRTNYNVSNHISSTARDEKYSQISYINPIPYDSEDIKYHKALDACTYATQPPIPPKSNTEKSVSEKTSKKSLDGKEYASQDFEELGDVEYPQKSVDESGTSKCTNYQRYFKVLLNPTFIVTALIFGVYGTTFLTFITIIIDFTRDIGVPPHLGKYVLMSFFLGCNVGLLSFGWVTDKGYLSLTNFTSLLLLLRGIFMLLIPFSCVFPTLMVVAALQGMAEASVMTLLPLFLAQKFTGETKEVAVASVFIFCAPIDLTMPPTLGFFRDTHGSYVPLFYLMSLLSFLCSIGVCFIPHLDKLKCRKKGDIQDNASSVSTRVSTENVSSSKSSMRY